MLESFKKTVQFLNKNAKCFVYHNLFVGVLREEFQNGLLFAVKTKFLGYNERTTAEKD